MAKAQGTGAKKARATEARQRRPPTSGVNNEEDIDQASGEAHDFGPWIETPSSSRVASFRYDYAKRETQVTWRNGIGPGYAYEGMSYEDFRSFARVASKGRYINTTLNPFGYHKLDADEVALPSNPKRRGVSRART